MMARDVFTGYGVSDIPLPLTYTKKRSFSRVGILYLRFEASSVGRCQLRFRPIRYRRGITRRGLSEPKPLASYNEVPISIEIYSEVTS